MEIAVRVDWHTVIFMTMFIYAMAVVLCRFGTKKVSRPKIRVVGCLIASVALCIVNRPLMLLWALPYPVWTVLEYLSNVFVLCFLITCLSVVHDRLRMPSF